jgi:hypothetical protein
LTTKRGEKHWQISKLAFPLSKTDGPKGSRLKPFELSSSAVAMSFPPWENGGGTLFEGIPEWQ